KKNKRRIYMKFTPNKIEETKVKVGDILVLKVKLLTFEPGERFEVTKVGDAIEVKNQYGVGHMSYDELRMFNIEEKKEEWSDWKKLMGYMYKTKGRKVIVKINGKHKVYRGYANCCEDDEYDLSNGIAIALKRAMIAREEDELNRLINK
ncbi:MAG: hypothetical protein ACRCTZ_03830, partial [Sarcina sp.]